MELVVVESGFLRRDRHTGPLAETLAVRFRRRVIRIMPGLIRRCDRVMLALCGRRRKVRGLHFCFPLERVTASGELLGGQASIGDSQAETEQPHQQNPEGPAAELLMAAKHEQSSSRI